MVETQLRKPAKTLLFASNHYTRKSLSSKYRVSRYQIYRRCSRRLQPRPPYRSGRNNSGLSDHPLACINTLLAMTCLHCLGCRLVHRWPPMSTTTVTFEFPTFLQTCAAIGHATEASALRVKVISMRCVCTDSASNSIDGYKSNFPSER
jgi:hypothetical protein